MTKYEQVWSSLRDEEYRHEYAGDVGTGVAFQIKLLRERRGWTQAELASRLGKRQETISLWENPDYGNYTLTTLKSLARAFDLAPVFRLGPFSETVGWNVNLTTDRLAPPSFDEECQLSTQGWTSLHGSGGAQPFTFPLASNVSISVHFSTPASTSFTLPTPQTEPPVATQSIAKEPKLALAA